jgi:phosphohistidine phosphatase
MHLYLLRHGDALAAAPADAQRRLSALGEEQARLAGAFLRRQGIPPDIVLASPLVRAEQTARLAVAELGAVRVQSSEHLVPTSDPGNLLRELRSLEAHTVLCVGHEPHLSTTISLLISGSRNARVTMETASLAALEAEPPFAPGSGVLRWILPPARMR